MNRLKLTEATNYMLDYFRKNPTQAKVIQGMILVHGNKWDSAENNEGCRKGITLRNNLRVAGFGEDVCGIPAWESKIPGSDDTYFFKIINHVVHKI